MRVVIADDSMIVREGMASLLRGAGVDVVGETATADDLLREVDEQRPDVAIVDVRMPPTHTDEGLRAAHEIRMRHPGMGIVVLSQQVEVGVALRMLTEHLEGLGYLIKDRVMDLQEFLTTLDRVAAGGTALDPEVVSRLLRAHDEGPLRSLTAREREVLELLAEGRSNQAIAERMTITVRSTEKYVSSVFDKLGLPATGAEHRRVLAVLRYLHR